MNALVANLADSPHAPLSFARLDFTFCRLALGLHNLDPQSISSARIWYEIFFCGTHPLDLAFFAGRTGGSACAISHEFEFISSAETSC